MGLKTESELALAQQLMNQLTPLQIYIGGIITGGIIGIIIGVMIPYG